MDSHYTSYTVYINGFTKAFNGFPSSIFQIFVEFLVTFFPFESIEIMDDENLFEKIDALFEACRDRW